MDSEEHDQEHERPRPRVVDKRVSARGPGTDTPRAEPVPPREPAEPAPPAPAEEPPAAESVWTPEQEEQARRLAEELARTPARDLVLTFAMNFVEVASIKLQAGDLAGAQLAIDAFDGVLKAVGPRLGEAEKTLASYLAQLQMAYAQRAAGPTPGSSGAPG
jgi:hypothetical protein